MNYNLIIENLSLFTVIAMDVALVKYVVYDSNENFTVNILTLGLSGGLTLIFKEFLSLFYSLPLMLIKGANISSPESFSKENIVQTTQVFYSILIFNLMLFTYLKYLQHSRRRTQRLIEEGKKKRVESSKQ